MTEKHIQKKGIDYLHSIGTYTVKVIQANKSGVPDVLACVPMTKDQVLELFKGNDKIGVFIGLEFKNPNGKGKTSPIQHRNIKQINAAGGIAATDIISVDDIKELIGH